jgi:tellurite resistance protein TehA-like permease
VFFVLNLVISVCAVVLYTARWAIAPRATAALVLHDHTEAPYLAAIVIAFSTLVAMLALACAGPWGHGWAVLAYVLWWVVAVLSMVVATALPFVM